MGNCFLQFSLVECEINANFAAEMYRNYDDLVKWLRYTEKFNVNNLNQS